MRKLIYIVMRKTDFGIRPEVAFNFAKEAVEYGKQKYDVNGAYNWYVSNTFLKDEK